ncbi:unnamed protein product [Clonostachys byssicola]|uniref:Uncharacterized protein n=1 Tax=Clonostachys byssicola TaxID=160290 RepID=A0A9N9ULB2_9HYPO|nr:unnamed protein product [Clonostachys byssicola]
MSKQSRKSCGLKSERSHDEIKDIFPDAETQEGFALFRLPLETRWTIYELIFSEVEVPEGRYMNHIGEKDFEDTSLKSSAYVNKVGKKMPYWLRPDCTTRTMIWTDFLQTCKRVYNEAGLFPVSINKHKCYQIHGPGEDPGQYLERFTSRQLTQVRRLHFYTQQHTLDDSAIPLRKQLKMASVALEHLVITIRNCSRRPPGRSDPSAIREPLQVNPYRRGLASWHDMTEDMESMENGDNLLMLKSGWAGIFAQFHNLKTLTIEFEHHEGFEDELGRLAQWAQKWRFPLQEGHVLTDGPGEDSRYMTLRFVGIVDCSGQVKPEQG